METFKIKNLTFYYPEAEKPVLDNLSFDVEPGEFLVLVGPSGCGKSTLLRQLKTVLAPHGEREGEILFEGKALDEISQRDQASKIGFVQQSPENQIVTDKVWHELAFGLESLGYDTPAIRARVAEMASFFGIQNWFYKNVAELSGGQKQLLNLASIMALQPSVLILDEPTSQLDPIAASDFLATVAKINRELGTTIILTEHRLEEVFPVADKVIFMERGSVVAAGSPREVGMQLQGRGHGMFRAMPAAMRIWAAAGVSGLCPLTVREGRDWMDEFAASHTLQELPPPRTWRGAEAAALTGSVTEQHVQLEAAETAAAAAACAPGAAEKPEIPAVLVDGIWFKYEKDAPDVVKGVSLELKKGELLAVLGGNGTGKSTTLSIIGGLRQPYRGSVKVNGSLGVLPQNPKTLFVKKTVREDLFEIFRGSKESKERQHQKVERVVSLCRLEELLDRHPYDLSGGEQQRAALAKVLLLDPDILLLDEPTKGLDAEFKQSFAVIIKSLQAKGVSIFMVSHDVEFCAEYADRCALFFDGNIVTEGEPRRFFSGNSFYTTSANRIARKYIEKAVTAGDVIACCGGEVPPLPELSEIKDLPDEPEEKIEEKKLPMWRKVLALISGAAVIFSFVKVLGVTDLSEIVTENGVSGLVGGYAGFYPIIIVSLLVFAFAVSRKSKAPAQHLQVAREKRKLPKRTLAAAVIILLLIPLTIFIGAYYLDSRKYYFISLLILFEIMVPFALVFEGRKPQARELVVISVLCALGIAGRAAFFMLPSFKPVMAIVIVSAVAFGGESGFLVGAVTMLLSNMLFGQGPWTPWQMFTMGLIGYLAGVLYQKGLLRRNRASLCVFGALAALIIYGGIMNPAAALIWLPEINKEVIIAYYMTGFPVDLVHAFATALFLWFGAEPMLEKLDRIKVKYGLVEQN